MKSKTPSSSIALFGLTFTFAFGTIAIGCAPDAFAGHGGRNGGDPRELYLHNHLQILVDYLASPGASIPEMESRHHAILSAAANRVHFRVSAEAGPCVKKEPELPVITVSLEATCFPALAQDRSALYTELFQKLDEHFLLPSEREELGRVRLDALLAAAKTTHPNRIAASRRFIRHSTCAVEFARGSRIKGSVSDAIEAALKNRGYVWSSENGADPMTIGIRAGSLALMSHSPAGESGRSLALHLNAEDGPSMIDTHGESVGGFSASSKNSLERLAMIRSLPWCWKSGDDALANGSSK